MHWRRLLVGGVVIAVLAWVAGYLERQPETPGTAGGLVPAGQGGPGVADSTQGEIRTVRLYFASTGGDKLVSETREVSSPAGLHGQVESLVRELALGQGLLAAAQPEQHASDPDPPEPAAKPDQPPGHRRGSPAPRSPIRRATSKIAAIAASQAISPSGTGPMWPMPQPPASSGSLVSST